MSSILIVDDSRFARRVMRRVLEELGHTVDEAVNASEALEKYFLRRHDLVTLDLLMPDMDGLAVLAKLRELNPAVKTIVATADIQTSTRDEVCARGASALVNKPLKKEELQQTVTRLLAAEVTPC
jgi:CheY-like chemotaxis protein